MRFVLALLAALTLAATPALPVVDAAAAHSSSSALALEQQPSGQIDVNVDTDGGAWWANPVWIGLGVLALVMLVLIVALAARGGGTTVIKD